MEMSFIRERISALRVKKGVSEAQMSKELGHSSSFITQITSGRSNPSLQELLYIIDYFDISPAVFFSPEEVDKPMLIEKIDENLRDLSESDLLMLITFINRLKQKQ